MNELERWYQSYKNNFQKLVDDFEKTNAQLYQITNSRSYKLALKFNSLFLPSCCDSTW